MKKILLIILSGLVISAFGNNAPLLKVKPHSKYGFPLVVLNKKTIIGFTLQIHGKKFELLGRQSPYARGTMDINQFKTTGERTVVMGSFTAGDSIFSFVETIEKEESGDYLITYLVTPGQDSAVTVRLNGVVSAKEVFALKQPDKKEVIIPAKKTDPMPHMKFKEYMEIIPAVDRVPIYCIPVTGMGLIQAVDKRKWNQGVRLELFSDVTGWRAVKKIKANDTLSILLRISLKKPEAQNDTQNRR